MVFFLEYFQHRRDCRFKQTERAKRIRALIAYRGPITAADRATVAEPIENLVKGVQDGSIAPLSLLRTYGKIALKAHAKTNCVTEVLIPAAEQWLSSSETNPTTTTSKPAINLSGPLAGIPISLKDTVVVGGFDTTVGYSSFVGNKTPSDGPMVRLLKDAGAVPYVKTNLPITLLSFESTNDVWGRCTNPHSKGYSPGGSTGGEAALLALGGRIGIGSDVAGSVRAPAHFSGCYSLRCSTGRWPKAGICTSMPGQEGVPSVYSPMARTLADLRYFSRAVVKMEPWRYDYTVHPLAWREDVEREYTEKKTLRVGVLRTDGVVPPSPACARALSMVETALKGEGHDVEEITDAPDMYEALKMASQLLNADGCRTFLSFMRFGEWNDPAAAQMAFMMKMPSPLRYMYYLWVKYVRRDHIWAGLIRDWRPKTAHENWQLVSQREAYRAKWFDWWDRQKFDVIITPPNATPAVPHDGMHYAASSCGYTFLWNLLDYTAGVIPVTHVDWRLDGLSSTFSLRKLNGVAQGAYKLYDARKMHGLPVGVQVVGRRLEEEKVLAVMDRIESALGDKKYKLLPLDALD